jgi:hypothetical protein
VTPEIVNIIFECAICVRSIGRDSGHSQGTLDIVDRVRGVIDITYILGRGGAEIRGGRGDRNSRISTGPGSACCRSRGSFSGIGIVESIGVDKNWVCGFSRQGKRNMHRLEGEVVTSAATNAEGRYFTHVNPCTIRPGDLMVSDHLVNPPFLGAFRQPVRENSVSRPDSTDIETAIGVFKKDPASFPLSKTGYLSKSKL